MALQLKKSIVRNAAINSAVCLSISLVLAWWSGANPMAGNGLWWLALLVAGAAGVSIWLTVSRIRNGVLGPLGRLASYVRIERDSQLAQQKVDWSAIDDYAVQLQTRGFHKLGEFTAYPLSSRLAGVAALFTNDAGDTMIEVQQLKLLPAAGSMDFRDGIYFSVTSLAGGNIRVVTCNHKLKAANWLMRGAHDVCAVYPGAGLLELLERHKATLERLQMKTGKAASPGLSMERYICAIREAQAQARQRLSAMGGFAIAGAIDQFEAQQPSRWAPASATLKALPLRPLSALEQAFGQLGQPAVLDEQQARTLPATSVRDSQAARLAGWFYAVAAVSLANTVAMALGSSWGFAIGLASIDVLGAMARTEVPGAGTGGMLVAGCVLASGLFALIGWLARRPSVVAYTVGIVLFGLDTLLFLLPGDVVGILFHLLALYYMVGGWRAARRERGAA